MTAAISFAYVVGGAAGVVVGALGALAVVGWLIERLDRATTVPTQVEPSAVVIDLHGRRSTRSWSA